MNLRAQPRLSKESVAREVLAELVGQGDLTRNGAQAETEIWCPKAMGVCMNRR
jgi:hypothetical protein